MFLEIVLAILSLYLAFIVQYLTVAFRTYQVSEIHIPLSLRELVRSVCNGANVEYRLWKVTDSNVMIMAAFYMPPLNPVIVFDGKVLMENVETAKVFLAHELGHIKRRSQLKLFLFSVMLITLTFYISYISEIASLAVFLVLIIALLMLYRYEEFKADEYAASIVGYEKVLSVYSNLASKQGQMKVKLYSNPALIVVSILKKLGIYPSITDRIKNLYYTSKLVA